MKAINKSAFLTCGISAAFYMYELAMRVIFGTFQNDLCRDFNWTPSQFALISSAIYLGIYAAMQLPAGFIINRYRVRPCLIGASFILCLSTFASAISVSAWQIIASRITTAASSSFGFIILVSSVYSNIPAQKRSGWLGLCQLIGGLGPVLAGGPLQQFSHFSETSWREAFLGFGVFGLIIFLFSYFCVHENQKRSEGLRMVQLKPAWRILRENIIFCRQFWIVSASIALLYCPIELLSESHGMEFFSLKHQGDSASFYAMSCAWIGFMLGCPIVGALGDITKKKKQLLIACTITAMLSLGAAFLIPNVFASLFFMFFVGLGSAGFTNGFSLLADWMENEALSLSTAMANLLVLTVNVVLAPVVGRIFEVSQIESSPTLAPYLYAFIPLMIGVFLALILSTFFVKETYGKNQVTFNLIRAS